MPISLDEDRGKYLELLGQQLQDRRWGWSGRRRWRRDLVASSKNRPALELLDDYRRGDPPLNPDIHTDWTAPWRRFVRMGRLNIADLLVAAPSNRLTLRDFQTAAAGDELGDAEARTIMRRNHLKVKARDLTDMALSFGDAYTLVTPPGRRKGKDDFSLITVEDPREAITAHDPATGEVKAGLKMFRDEWDTADLAYLYMPGKAFVGEMKGPSLISRRRWKFVPEKWDWRDADEVNIPDERIPMHRFQNRRGMGEFEQHLDTLDRINDKIFREWWIAVIQAFRQRAIENLPDTETVIEDGKEVEKEIDYTGMFTSSPDELWRVPKDVKFWESNPVDMTPLTNSIQKDLERLAAATANPLHTISPDAANGSAEGAGLKKEEHIAKIEDRRDRFDAAWAATMGDAFFFQRDTKRADVTQINTIWGPIERYGLQEKAQAASQAKGTLPEEKIWTDIWQYEPAEVPDLRIMQGRSMSVQFQVPGQSPGGAAA